MLKLKHITKSFGETIAINDINLHIRQNEVTFIVGESGSGKTTLLQLLGGTEAPTAGEILFDDKNIAIDTTAYRANCVGFVYQDFNLIPGLTVEENIVLGRSICGQKIDSERLQKIISDLGLPREKQKAETLSGGEKQRVAIARALLKDAEIILADEPTGNLDPANADKIFECLRGLKRDRYIIIVTHDHERARIYGDRVISLQNGKVVRDEQLANANPVLEQAKSNAPQKNSRHYPSPIRMLVQNSLKRRLGRVLAIALVLALTITTLAIALDLQTLGEQVEKNVNISYLETDMLRISKSPYETDDSFSTDEILLLQEAFPSSVLVGTYHKWSDFSFSYGSSLVAEPSIKCIELTNFFSERVSTNQIEGSFPSNAKEIILATDVATVLFGTSEVIGKQVVMQNGKGQTYTFSVCGINHTVNPQGKIYTYIASDAMESIVLAAAESALETGIYSFGSWKVQKRMLAQNVDLLYGRLPSSPDEVLLSHTALTMQYLEDVPALSLQEVEAGLVQQKVLDAIYAENICVHGRDYTSKPLHVVGFYYLAESDPEGDGSLIKEIGFTDETWNALHAVYPTEIEIYFSGIDEAKSARETIEAEGWVVDSSLQVLQNRVGNWTMLYAVTMLIIGGILAVILLVFLLAFSRILLIERRHEIAVLRSLGAKGKTIFVIVLCDFLFIYFVAILISSLLNIIYPIAFSHLLSELSYIEIYYPWRSLLSISGISLIALGLWACPSILRFLKISPATLLKEK